MTDIMEALREAHGKIHAAPDAYERWVVRQERRARNRRVRDGLFAGVLALAVAVAATVALMTSRSGRHPAGGPDRGPAHNGLIAYADGAQLFTVRPDGTRKSQIPIPPGGAWLPSWSPDGTELAVTIFPAGEGARSVWVMTADGSGSVQVASGRNVSRASWSPDGTQLTVTVTGSGGSAIHVVNADGSDDHVVSAVDVGGKVSYLDVTWSPDGAQIAYSEGTDAGFDIFVMEADGSNVERLSHSGHDYDPAWSPDGSMIAFTRQGTGPQSDIYLMDADGSHVRRLTDDGEAVTNLDPQWSPDGTRIAYIAGKKGGPGPLIAMDPDGSDPVTLIHGDLVGFSWQPVFDRSGLASSGFQAASPLRVAARGEPLRRRGSAG
jgi:Tol biopolymer transport system component